MIIGKDKERVRLLEVECQLAKELIETIRNDMERIRDELYDKNIVDITSDPYWKLSDDIGRCSGHLISFK